MLARLYVNVRLTPLDSTALLSVRRFCRRPRPSPVAARIVPLLARLLKYEPFQEAAGGTGVPQPTPQAGKQPEDSASLNCFISPGRRL
ncbi:MAG: hypothetical protein Kow00109_22710 [Acidobacteriota bacterium]